MRHGDGGAATEISWLCVGGSGASRSLFACGSVRWIHL